MDTLLSELLNNGWLDGWMDGVFHLSIKFRITYIAVIVYS